MLRVSCSSRVTAETKQLKLNKSLLYIWVLQDVGHAILESYSRVLEGLAFNIVAWIDDVLYVDKTMSGSE